ncbi:MAG: LacI family DNA-binding transcriptional regulator [Clostridia bacterium]|nr:LacI family DNA-binding transcriptional regulator [Clostridia bacterium]
MKPLTIRDIAQLSGCSVATVSRVMNHKPDVSAATRARVEAVLEKQQFVGNANARGLKQAGSEAVAVILRGRGSVFLGDLAEAIISRAESSPVPWLIEYIDEWGDEVSAALRLSRERSLAGLVFVGGHLDERSAALNALDIPMVFVTLSIEGSPLKNASSVCIDDRGMTSEAVHELLLRGCQRVAVFGGGSGGGRDSLGQRYLGVLDAHQRLGLRFDRRRYVPTRFTLEAACAAAKKHFTAFPDTDAAFCMSDTVAIGVIRALHDLGLRVPEDVSVIGVDGMELGQYTIPSLSTIVQPVRALAEATVAVLRGMMEEGAPPRQITVEATLRILESVRQ